MSVAAATPESLHLAGPKIFPGPFRPLGIGFSETKHMSTFIVVVVQQSAFCV